MQISCTPHAGTAMIQSSAVSMPTSQESLHLASLVPLSAANVAPASVPHVMATIFNLCRNRWVADFLFSSDMNPLSALTAPVNLGHSISCSVTTTAVERDVGLPRISGVPPNPFDLHVRGDYVFVPSFSVGSISVGFGVQNCSVTCNSEWGRQPYEKVRTTLNHFRYVRDDEKGILVNIREDPTSDWYKVDYMAHETLTKRKRSFLTVERTAIQNILKQDPAGLDPMKLVPAVRLVQTVEEYRDCPLCGVPKGTYCNCKFQLQQPKHPLDFENMLVNMSSWLGSYEGVTSARFVSDGMETIRAKLGSRITIDCRLDSDIVDRLSKWAITDQLHKVTEDPLRCIMPAGDTQMTDQGLAGRSSGFANGEATGVSVGGELAEHEIDNMLEMDALVEEMIGPSKDAGFGEVAITGIDEMLSLNKDGLSALPAQQPFEHASPDSAEENDELGLTSDIAREAQLAYRAENEVSDHTVPSGSSSSDAPTTSRYSATDDVVLSEEARRKKEKERKAELRKQRNREAAQRSNAKRKEKNDTLKADLRDVHAKASELRAKELVLREENIRLRKMLSS